MYFRPVASVILLRGCLRPGAQVICGTHHGKVRSMLDSSDKVVKAAYPGMAVTITGWRSLPNAGDEVLQGTEANVKKAIANRERKADLQATMGDLEAINEQRRLERDRREVDATEEASGESVGHHQVEQGPKELRLVVKGDVSGSVEAVVDALQSIGNKEACVRIVSSGVGDVTESDVLRAQAAQGKYLRFTQSTGGRLIYVCPCRNHCGFHRVSSSLSRGSGEATFCPSGLVEDHILANRRYPLACGPTPSPNCRDQGHGRGKRLTGVRDPTQVKENNKGCRLQGY